MKSLHFFAAFAGGAAVAGTTQFLFAWKFNPQTDATTESNESLWILTLGLACLACPLSYFLWTKLHARTALARQREMQAAVAERTRELEAARLLAERSLRSKSEFLASMSHEIRTPLTAILGFADELLASGQSETQRLRAAATIRRNGQYLLLLVNDVLDISKIEAGGMSVERITCDPVEIIEEVRSLLAKSARDRQLSFTFSYDFPVPRRITTDPSRLRQILTNLVGNAIKFTQHGGVHIHCALEGPARRTMRFEIRDTGIGIRHENLGRLFTVFSQADASMSRRFGGTGLGLAISHRLAIALGGDLTVESEYGRGSVFAARVDIGDLDESSLWHGEGTCAPSDSSAAPSPVALSSSLQGSLRGTRILVAEDGPDNQTLIQFHLQFAEAEIVIVENGSRAVEEITHAARRGLAFDLVLMDMQMPLMDGYAATARLRALGFTLPIIALTAQAISDDRQRCLDAGCTEYAGKPIDRRTLIEVCLAHVSNTRAAA